MSDIKAGDLVTNETMVVDAPATVEHEAPVRLEHWRVCTPSDCPQGRGNQHLRGTVYGHPDKWGCPDGEIVCTSRLVTLNPPLAVTASRVYHLVGDPQQ